MGIVVPTMEQVKQLFATELNLTAKTPHVVTENLRVRNGVEFGDWGYSPFNHSVAQSPRGTVVRFTGGVVIEPHRDSQLVSIRRQVSEIRQFLTNHAAGRSGTVYLDWESDADTPDGNGWSFAIKAIYPNA